ncbi:hypothetical protein F3J44_26435 [Pantoea sp. Tr-811]|uniref:hypothetical protein n=1 Tax=Pantoea sp. Tr-811 TaxID=2608361 RepID=UPI00141EF8A1|nr:hypothetical protein [Pantoea sp. Tr-811]NIF29885.1 hypothetical protein [Pantoea sp. Tr-811]
MNYEQVMQWLGEKDRLNAWGSIAVFDRKMVNKLLLQNYIARYNSNSYLNPVSFTTDGTEERTRLESILLDKPRLSFENADITDSRGRLRMSVVGGNIVTQKLVNGNWYARKIEYLSPVQGPELMLDVKLPETPISVAKGGELIMDLRHSSDFRLMHVDNEDEQLRVGNLFKIYFEGLADEQRRYTLGALPENTANPFMQPESFYARTQGKVQGDENGAVLMFVKMRNSGAPTFPEEFPWLLDDQTSAVVLYQGKRVFLPWMAKSLVTYLRDWLYEFDAQGLPKSAVIESAATLGPDVYFDFPLQRHGETVHMSIDGFSYIFNDRSIKLEYVESESGQPSMRLTADCYGHPTFHFLNSYDAQGNSLIPGGDVHHDGYVPERQNTFSCSLTKKYTVSSTYGVLASPAELNDLEITLGYNPHGPKGPQAEVASQPSSEIARDSESEILDSIVSAP